MKQLSRLIFFIVILSHSKSFSQTTITVYGELRAIMQRGDFSAKVLLDTLTLRSNSIGLGVAEGLKGEIFLVGGVWNVSSIVDGKVVNAQRPKISAAMLVTTQIQRELKKMDTKVESIKQLEALVESYARDKQFAFVLDSVQGSVSYHIIDWDSKAVHTAENHKKFAMKFNVDAKFSEEPVIIIGFYSSEPGVFTPHTSKVHLHAYMPRTGTVGHVDELNLKEATLHIF